MSEAKSESKKRKKYYGVGSAKRWRGNRELQAGMQGILITCNRNQAQCRAEAYNLLNEYGDALYGPEQLAEPEVVKNSEEEAEEGEDDDAEAALKKEVQQIQTQTQKRQRRFTALDSGANNVVFIRTLDVDPDLLVHRILKDVYDTGKLKSRAILRMLPVSGSCKAFPEDMMIFLNSFLQPWFLSPKYATYQVCYKARNSSHSMREEVIKNVAGLVNKLNPLNKVNLSQPELSIIIEVIKSVCCVSVVRDYTRFRKYNLQELAKERPGRKEGRNEPKNEPTDQKLEQNEPSSQETDQQEVTKSQTNPEEDRKEGGATGEEEVSQDNGVKGAEQE